MMSLKHDYRNEQQVCSNKLLYFDDSHSSFLLLRMQKHKYWLLEKLDLLLIRV